MFRLKCVHMCSGQKYILGLSLMINFVVVDWQLHVLDTRVKGRVKLSTNHYLVVSWF